MSAEDIESGLQQLKEVDVLPESIHFHLRGNVRTAETYGLALQETYDLCRKLDFEPLYLDLGGGLPVPGEWPADADLSIKEFDLKTLRKVYDQVPQLLPSVREIWLENGRFVTARSSVLVMRVLDIKKRNNCRYLICDGGRTNQALVSDWEAHNLYTIPDRTGQLILTTICGPTCMAFDRLARRPLPSDIDIGDHVVWMNAGAYHIPWETRFSHGLCTVLWHDEIGKCSIARKKESFQNWWSQWE
jgi:diaminopimelate decarboxylase